MPRLLLNVFSFFLSIMITTPGYSMPDDREKPATLLADKALLNQQTHYAEYLGHIRFKQGTSHLEADKASTRMNEQNKLIEAIARGTKNAPAHFWTQTAIGKPILHAFAHEIYYYPFKNQIELKGNARVTQGKDFITAPIITYNTMKQHVFSNGDVNKPITIVIHPEKKI